MKRLLVCLLLVGVVGCGLWEQVAQQPTAGQTTVNSIGMKLTFIPAGEFQMGSPDAEQDREDNETRHLVKITKPFYLGVYEVTQQQYEQVMGTRPWESGNQVKRPELTPYPLSHFTTSARRPICFALRSSP